MSKRSPEDLLKSIEETSIDDDIERALSMTAKERRDELLAAGFSEEELAAKVPGRGKKVAAESVREPSSARPAAESPSRPRSTAPVVLRPRRRMFYVLAAAATLSVGVPAGIFVARWLSPREPAPLPSPPPPTPSPSAPPSPPPLGVAELRSKAINACKAMRWRECKDDLDRASAYDPAGDHDPLVALARTQALAGLAEEGDADLRNQNAKGPGDLRRR